MQNTLLHINLFIYGEWYGNQQRNFERKQQTLQQT